MQRSRHRGQMMKGRKNRKLTIQEQKDTGSLRKNISYSLLLLEPNNTAGRFPTCLYGKYSLGSKNWISNYIKSLPTVNHTTAEKTEQDNTLKKIFV